MAQIGAAHTGYSCTREDRRSGWRHGSGVRKVRQDWSVGQVVNVGFMRDLTVTRAPTTAGEGYELVSKKGVRYGFEPHGGLFAL